jgi:Alkylmercury lyase
MAAGTYPARRIRQWGGVHRLGQPRSVHRQCLPHAEQCEPGGHGRAADLCCAVMNFLTDPDSAHAWITAHPQVTSVVLSHEQALRLGVAIFGRLLAD